MQISAAHWHLLLNHFPIVLSLTGTLFLIAAFISKKDFLKLSGLIILIIAALLSWPAFSTGQNAEDPVEEIAGVSREAINTHSDLAVIGFRIMIVTGIIAFISLVLLNRKHPFAKYFIIFSLIGGLISSGYLGYVGYTGGEIRHAEIRGDFFGK